MEYQIYETRAEAEAAAGALAVMQVSDGYQVMDYADFERRSREEAEALQAGGWKSTDKEELKAHYNIDEEHAAMLCGLLEDLEGA